MGGLVFSNEEKLDEKLRKFAASRIRGLPGASQLARIDDHTFRVSPIDVYGTVLKLLGYDEYSLNIDAKTFDSVLEERGVLTGDGPLLVLRDENRNIVNAGAYLGSKQARRPPTIYTTTKHVLLMPNWDHHLLLMMATTGWPQPRSDSRASVELYSMVRTEPNAEDRAWIADAPRIIEQERRRWPGT